MSDQNTQTLDTYQAQFANYIEGTPQVTKDDEGQAAWFRLAVKSLPHDAKILEIGSATGRDAAYIESLGYTVETTDAFDAAVEYLLSHGFNARKLNVLTDRIDGKYDLIIAAAVFLHFTEQDFRLVLEVLHENLADAGRLAIRLKNGEGEEWSSAKMESPRYFRYWNPSTLSKLLEECGYEIQSLSLEEDDKWLHVIVTSTRNN
jgi:cyclopropane fatty-acyl-phospholipid synthase-like methyltransferase